MKRHIILCLTLFFALFSSTHQKLRAAALFDITGAWVLVKITYADGTEQKMNMNEYTRVKIFFSDSTYCSIQLKRNGSDTLIIPHELARYTLRLSPTDTTYIENNRVTEFQILNDSTMTTVWNDYVETMQRATTMTESRKQEILNIVRNHQNEHGEVLKEYVLSTTERELKNTISAYQNLFVIGLFIVLLIIIYVIHIVHRKREVEQNLLAIKEELESRPAVLATAMKKAEEDFFRSDYYNTLRQHIEAGDNLTDDEWQELERQVNTTFTGFSRKLRSLYNFSATEFRVCLLLKLRASNKDIAAVVNRAPESVSSIRNRLHKKVLGPNGGAKEWDEFISSL